jgi:hypothetical protein
MNPSDADNPYLPPAPESIAAALEESPLQDPRLRGWVAGGLIVLSCLVSSVGILAPQVFAPLEEKGDWSGITMLPAGIAFFFWIHRCVANALIMDRYSRVGSPGWAVGAYFVPFANLVIPCMTMVRLASSAFKYRPDGGMTTVVIVWWISFMVWHSVVPNFGGLFYTSSELARLAISGSTACYLIARISARQACFRWADVPESERPRQVDFMPTRPGHGPPMLKNRPPDPQPVKLPAKRLVPPPAPKTEVPQEEEESGGS